MQERWRELFNARFDVLLYDLTSTYFECDEPVEDGLRRFGYSRDKRSDCVQVVIALVVTPEGFPLGYEVLTGNTSDKTTLRSMLKKIEERYGQAERTWLMDRGIPTEEVLAEMRASTPPVRYLVGTPKGRLTRLEKDLTNLPWQQARAGVNVKLLPQGGEVYVLAKSHSRVAKERGIRQRKLKKLWRRLHEIKAQKNSYKDLLMKLGGARADAGAVWKLVVITWPEPPTGKGRNKQLASFELSLDKARLRQTRRQEGQYLLRSNLCQSDPAELWQHYMTLTQIEEAFKNLKGDLSIRPIYHKLDHRIEAHIFVAFLAYCLHATLRRRLHALAPGLTPRSVLEKFASMSMIDVNVPTTDGRALRLRRYTQPDKEVQLLLQKLKLTLPDQPPPRITSHALASK